MDFSTAFSFKKNNKKKQKKLEKLEKNLLKKLNDDLKWLLSLSLHTHVKRKSLNTQKLEDQTVV